MKVCFFTLLQDRYSSCIDFNLFEKSFKHFHPDIPLIVLRDKEINSLIAANPGVDMYKIKATAAKLFYNDYDLVVNIDADHIIFSRLDEILEGDYDVAAPSNFNEYENVSISIETYRGTRYNIVPERKYVQAGIVASTRKDFWDVYEKASLSHSDSMMCRDNDVLNLVLQFSNFKFKLLDGGWTPDDTDRKSFYGCSSLNLERECIIKGNMPKIRDIQLKCYHIARGGAKPSFNQLFNSDVVKWLYDRI